MVNKVMNEGQEKMISTERLFKDLTRGLGISFIYFPTGGKKRLFYWLFFLLLTVNDVLMVLRQSYVIKNEVNLTVSLLTAGITVYETGLMIMAIGCCYSITKYFPIFIETLENYRRCFGELKCLKRLNYFMKFGYLIFCILTPVLVILLQGSFIFTEIWTELQFTFWPFQVETYIHRLFFVLYATPKSLRTGGILILLDNLFMAVCYIIITESEVIEEKIINLIYHSSEGSKTLLYVQDLDPVCQSDNPPYKITDDISHTKNKHYSNVTTQRPTRGRFYLKTISAEEEEELEILRHRYEALLDIANVANDVLVNFISTAFASSLPVIMFVLYGAMKGESNVSMMFYLTIITLNVTSAMCLVLCIGSYTSVKIQKPLDHVMKINTGTASNKQCLTISMLTNRLAAPPGVFHVYQLFSIDTTAVVTIFGTLLTYSLVIFQFAQSSENGIPSLCSNISQVE